MVVGGEIMRKKRESWKGFGKILTVKTRFKQTDGFGRWGKGLTGQSHREWRDIDNAESQVEKQGVEVKEGKVHDIRKKTWIQDKLFEERLGKLEAWTCGVNQRESEESGVRKIEEGQKESNSDAGGAHYQHNPSFLELVKEREWIWPCSNGDSFSVKWLLICHEIQKFPNGKRQIRRFQAEGS